MSTIDHDTTHTYSRLWYLLIPLAVICILAGLYTVIRIQGIPFMMVPG